MAEETKKEQTAEQKPETAPKTYTEEQYKALENQLAEANKTIKSYTDMDIEGIKKSAEEWEQENMRSGGDFV